MGDLMKDDNKTKKQLVHELTELRSQNAALKKSESAEKYRSLVENIRDVIYELDSQGVVLYISPAVRDMLGYDSAEIVGKNFIELAHKDDLSGLAEWFSELRKGVESPYDYRVIKKSGEARLLIHRNTPLEVRESRIELYSIPKIGSGMTLPTNIGMSKVGLAMGADRIFKIIR